MANVTMCTALASCATCFPPAACSIGAAGSAASRLRQWILRGASACWMAGLEWALHPPPSLLAVLFGHAIRLNLHAQSKALLARQLEVLRSPRMGCHSTLECAGTDGRQIGVYHAICGGGGCGGGGARFDALQQAWFGGPWAQLPQSPVLAAKWSAMFSDGSADLGVSLVGAVTQGGRQLRLGVQLSLARRPELAAVGCARVRRRGGGGCGRRQLECRGSAGRGGASERIGVGGVQRQRPRAERGSLVARGVPGAELGGARPRVGARLGTGQGGRRAGVLGVAAGVGWRPDERGRRRRSSPRSRSLAPGRACWAWPVAGPSVWW